MATNKKKQMSLRGLLINKIQALYDAEEELLKALPKMAKAVGSADLRRAFMDHFEETRRHSERLRKIFDILREKSKKLKGDAIRGLIKDSHWVIKNVKNKEALDANLIAAAQYVEHYEMAGYGSASTWAKELGESEAENILNKTLDEEKAADEKLSSLAEEINSKAAKVN